MRALTASVGPLLTRRRPVVVNAASSSPRQVSRVRARRSSSGTFDWAQRSRIAQSRRPRANALGRPAGPARGDRGAARRGRRPARGARSAPGWTRTRRLRLGLPAPRTTATRPRPKPHGHRPGRTRAHRAGHQHPRAVRGRRRRDPGRFRGPDPLRQRPRTGQARRALPRTNASGNYTGKTTISGRGRPLPRVAAWRAVWGALRHNEVLAARHAHLTGRADNPLADNPGPRRGRRQPAPPAVPRHHHPHRLGPDHRQRHPRPPDRGDRPCLIRRRRRGRDELAGPGEHPASEHEQSRPPPTKARMKAVGDHPADARWSRDG